MFNFEDLRFTNETWVLVLPLALMGIDVVSGYMNAWKDKDIQSSKMRAGLVKKTGELIEIILVEVLGVAIGLPREVVQWISGYICFTEVVSIAENLAGMGVPMPAWLTSRLNQKYAEMNEGGTE